MDHAGGAQLADLRIAAGGDRGQGVGCDPRIRPGSGHYGEDGMLTRLRSIDWREVLPRALADFVTVHASMLLALAISVTYQTARGRGGEAQRLIAGFQHYYVAFFWLLSPIFPVVFLLNGFYTHSRAYVGKQKAWTILRGVVLAVLLFFGADF